MSGVRTGDLLVEINHKKIHSVGDYTGTMNMVKKGQNAYMVFMRGAGQKFVVRFEK
jgi:type II secretory pathway component PulC